MGSGGEKRAAYLPRLSRATPPPWPGSSPATRCPTSLEACMLQPPVSRPTAPALSSSSSLETSLRGVSSRERFQDFQCRLGMLRTELWASNKAPSALTASLALVSAHTACARGACALLVAPYHHVPVSPCHYTPRRCAAVPLRSHVRRRVATRLLG